MVKNTQNKVLSVKNDQFNLLVSHDIEHKIIRVTYRSVFGRGCLDTGYDV